MRWARKARWYSPIAILHRGRAGRPRYETARVLGLHKCTVQKYA